MFIILLIISASSAIKLQDHILQYVSEHLKTTQVIFWFECENGRDDMQLYGRVKNWRIFNLVHVKHVDFLKTSSHFEPKTVFIWPSFKCFSKVSRMDLDVYKSWTMQKLVHFVPIEDNSTDWKADVQELPTLLNTHLFVIETKNELINIFEVYSVQINWDGGQPTKTVLACTSRHAIIGLCDPIPNVWERRKDLSLINIRYCIANNWFSSSSRVSNTTSISGQ